jgi:hypothetical protein
MKPFSLHTDSVFAVSEEYAGLDGIAIVRAMENFFVIECVSGIQNL